MKEKHLMTQSVRLPLQTYELRGNMLKSFVSRSKKYAMGCSKILELMETLELSVLTQLIHALENSTYQSSIELKEQALKSPLEINFDFS
jgi:predicted DNA-binding protein